MLSPAMGAFPAATKEEEEEEEEEEETYPLSRSLSPQQRRPVLRRSDVLEAVACLCATVAAAAAATAAMAPTISSSDMAGIPPALSVSTLPLRLEMPWEVYYLRA
jgi:hypothetical protein